MQIFKLVVFSGLVAMAGACVTSIDDAATDDEAVLTEDDAAASEVASAIEATPAPLCPDLVIRLPYAESCVLPNGEPGIRECTDITTLHRSPVFKIGGIECKITGSSSRTVCGGCLPLFVPPF